MENTKEVRELLLELVASAEKVDNSLAGLREGIDSLLERGGTLVGPTPSPDEIPDHLQGLAGVVQVQVSVDEEGVRVHQVNSDDGRWFSFRVDPVGWAEVDAKVRGALEEWASGAWKKRVR